MVRRLGILGFILVAVTAASMAWAGANMGAIPAPKPTPVPAAAPAACMPMGPGGAPQSAMPSTIDVAPKKLVTSINVKMKYPKPAPPFMPRGGAMYGGGCGPAGVANPPIPVAVPMWKFIVPWPPFVYYLPVE